MGNIGDPITTGEVPAVGTSGTTYATNLNLFLTEVKARLEADVPRASLADGNLDLNGSALQDASYLGLTTQAGVPTTPNNTLQSYGGEVYWVSAAGVAKLTSSGALNAGSIGGITGDYGGANPAQFRFVDADQEYYAYDDYAGGAWARVWAKNVDIAAGATSAVRARLAYGGAASFTMTLPPTRPAASSTKFILMDENGALTASNTTTEAVTAADYLTTVSQDLVIPSMAMNSSLVSGASPHFYTGVWGLGNSTAAIWAPIVMRSGDKISNVRLYVNKSSDATNTLTFSVYKLNPTTGSSSLIGSPATLSTNAPGASTMDVSGLTETINSGFGYYGHLVQSDSTPSAMDTILLCRVTYARPV